MSGAWVQFEQNNLKWRLNSEFFPFFTISAGLSNEIQYI
jgi:hypothetical protein